MKVERNRIVFFREISPTEKIIPSTGWIARGLAEKGWKVAWIWGPIPSSIVRIITLGHKKSGVSTYFKGGRWIEDGFFEYIPLSIKPYLQGLPSKWIDEMFRYTFPSLIKKLKHLDLYEPDVLCIASPALLSAIYTCKPKMVVYHCPVAFWKFDYLAPCLRMAHERLVMIADKVIVPTIADKLDLVGATGKDSRKVHVVTHGANTNLIDRNIDIASRSGIVCIGVPYATDLQLLRQVAEGMDNIKIKIIGPFTRKERKKFRGLKNIEFYGLLPYDRVLEVLSTSLVGLICYSEDIRTRKFAGNTMKLYDYTAARLPVVSVPLLESYGEAERGPVKTASNAAEFIDSIKEAIENWEIRSQISAEFARHRSWRARTEEFIRIIEEE